MVYVLSKDGKPLMPTERHGKVRRMLNSGEAKVVETKPFTIQLTYETTEYAQPTALGVDSGYNHIGFSVVTDKKELISGEINLLQGMSEHLKERSMYRRQRRNSKCYRKPRFDNRKRHKDWLAPSIQHKLDSHIRFIEYLKSIIPINNIIVEVANFDIQKIKNPSIEGKAYQEGEQSGYYNLREYILHRDNHECQNPSCTNKAKDKILEVHHIGFWRGDRSSRSNNLITLGNKCHTPKNHKESNFLYGCQPKLKSFKPETFMSTVRWRLVNNLQCQYTYGHITKHNRIELGLEKTHYNDAFVIAGGTGQVRINPVNSQQIRRNNRSLEYFYDAKYIDTRTGEKVSGQELFSGRRVRSKNFNDENLHKYRGHKVSKGRRNIRRKRYFYQPKDIVLFEGKKLIVQGVQNKGAYIRLAGLSRPVKTEKVKPYKFMKGFCA